MRFSTNKIITLASIALGIIFVVFSAGKIYGEDKITAQKLSGIWWTYDANDVPWAIQFNKDGTFRIAHTVLRLEKLPKDEGSFQLEGNSLILISNKDCEGPCKGLEGNYKVEFTKFDKLLLKEQDDQCLERKEVCRAPWGRVLE